jgi:hypothetical protein
VRIANNTRNATRAITPHPLADSEFGGALASQRSIEWRKRAVVEVSRYRHALPTRAIHGAAARRRTSIVGPISMLIASSPNSTGPA